MAISGSKDGYPGLLIETAVQVVDENNLTIIGAQVTTADGVTKSLGEMPSDDATIVYEGDVYNSSTGTWDHLTIWEEPALVDVWNNPEIIGSALWLNYTIYSSQYETDYDMQVYLCSINKCK
jgi:hypothetical protein